MLLTPEAVAAISAAAAERLGIMPLSSENGDLIVASEHQLDSAAINELTLLSRMHVVQVLASGAEIEARRAEAYGELSEESMLSDASAIRFESMEVIEGFGTYDPQPDEKTFREETEGLSDPHLIEAIERALIAVESGGTLDIRVEARHGERVTTIRLKRDA